MRDPARSDAQQAILDLLAQRDPGKTICPSEAARALGGHEHMELVREAAGVLRERGEVAVTQRGEPVDPATARGPIRLGRPSRD